MPFFPLALRFMAFLLRHAWKSKFWELIFKIFVLLFYLFPPFLFPFLIFCCSDWPSTGLASSSKNSEKTSSRQAIFTIEQPLVVTGNFALSFSLKFLSIFVHVSRVTVIWASLERSFPPEEIEYGWCQFQSKAMTSEVEQRPRHVTAGSAWESMG